LKEQERVAESLIEDTKQQMEEHNETDKDLRQQR